MSKFTSGEWEVEAVYGDHPIVTVAGRIVADCFNNRANARLIASAPEMYKLLKVWTEIQAQPTLMEAQKKAEELLAYIDGEDVAE